MNPIGMKTTIPMYTHFHGWRRKAGVVTLVIAMAFTAGWIRNIFVYDICAVILWGRDYWLCSGDDEVTIASWAAWPEFGSSWRSESNEKAQNLRDLTERVRADKNLAIFYVSYQLLVIPLTFVSAYLILWKPRKRS